MNFADTCEEVFSDSDGQSMRSLKTQTSIYSLLSERSLVRDDRGEPEEEPEGEAEEEAKSVSSSEAATQASARKLPPKKNLTWTVDRLRGIERENRRLEARYHCH